MMKKSGGVLVIALLLAALAASSAFAATVDSKVTLHIKNARFFGKVTSARAACVVGRKVVLIRKEANGDRTQVTGTFASESGRYRVQIPQQAGNRFYAKVRRVTTPGGTVCRADRSITKTA